MVKGTWLATTGSWVFGVTISKRKLTEPPPVGKSMLPNRPSAKSTAADVAVARAPSSVIGRTKISTSLSSSARPPVNRNIEDEEALEV